MAHDVSVPHFDNVDDETALKHFNRLLQIKADIKAMREELKEAWDAAEADGIDKKPFDAAMKLLEKDPHTAGAYLRKLRQYTVQLGLLDRIEAMNNAEAREAEELREPA